MKVVAIRSIPSCIPMCVPVLHKTYHATHRIPENKKVYTHLQSVEHKDNSKRRIQVSNDQLYLAAWRSQIVCEMLKGIIVPHAWKTYLAKRMLSCLLSRLSQHPRQLLLQQQRFVLVTKVWITDEPQRRSKRKAWRRTHRCTKWLLPCWAAQVDICKIRRSS